MNLTNYSINIIKSNTTIVKKCNSNLSSEDLDNLKNYIYLFYRLINRANKSFNKNYNLIEKVFEYNNNFNNDVRPKMWISEMFPNNIKKYIETTSSIKIKYTIKIYSRTFSLYFYIYNDEEHLNKIDNYVRRIYIWLWIVNEYIKENCSKSTNIYIFLTPFEKKLPNNINKILDHNNVNTAFTMSCCNNNGEIIIYRKEEWFKVLIHECFHSFDLDFSRMNIEKLKYKMKKRFKIKSDFLIYESYCEVWARIINSLIVSYDLIENKNLNKYIEISIILLEFERLYSLQQCKNILNYMKISYSDLIHNKENNYNENSNVFAYYIISGILMNKYYDFMNWCYYNNENFIKFDNNNNNMILYGKLIIDNSKKEFIDEINCLENSNNNICRMSCIEI
jgi:hypothetical protein